ncbi:MAG: hypothetical protein IKF77_03015 [Thermoguttaceae bacterium]|nr:hypothetical protein [Thermoguttaceae bacterium]
MIILALLPIVFSILRADQAVDTDTLLAHIKQRVVHLETLYNKGIDVEMECSWVEEGKDEPNYPSVTRVIYRGLYELNQQKYISRFRSSPPEDGYDEDLTVRNPKYSFSATKSLGESGYTAPCWYDKRDGVLSDEDTSGLLYDTTTALVGLYIGGSRLRDLLDSNTFKVESAEMRENQYRLVFRCQFQVDDYNQIVGGEMFFGGEDYALEELSCEGRMVVPDHVYPWSRRYKYTYGDWGGIKYPKSWEYRRNFDNKTSRSRITVRSFKLGAPKKNQFYLKYYGIYKWGTTKKSDTPRKLLTSAVCIAVGLILIASGIYLKRSALAGAKNNKNSGSKSDAPETQTMD